MRSGQGNPDEARSARYILKDYVNAKLLFCHPPPSIPDLAFNQRTHEIALARVAGKKHAPITRVGKDADTYVSSPAAEISAHPQGIGQKSRALDKEFFAENSNLVGRAFSRGQEFSRDKIYPHQNMISDDGTTLGAHHGRLAAVLASQNGVLSGKKHHKKMKRTKNRSGKGYD